MKDAAKRTGQDGEMRIPKGARLLGAPELLTVKRCSYPLSVGPGRDQDVILYERRDGQEHTSTRIPLASKAEAQLYPQYSEQNALIWAMQRVLHILELRHLTETKFKFVFEDGVLPVAILEVFHRFGLLEDRNVNEPVTQLQIEGVFPIRFFQAMAELRQPTEQSRPPAVEVTPSTRKKAAQKTSAAKKSRKIK